MSKPTHAASPPSTSPGGLGPVAAGDNEHNPEPDLVALKAWASLAVMLNNLLGSRLPDETTVTEMSCKVLEDSKEVMWTFKAKRRGKKLIAWHRAPLVAPGFYRFVQRAHKAAIRWKENVPWDERTDSADPDIDELPDLPELR